MQGEDKSYQELDIYDGRFRVQRPFVRGPVGPSARLPVRPLPSDLRHLTSDICPLPSDTLSPEP